MRRVKLGQVAVDSGQVLIVDPAYLVDTLCDTDDLYDECEDVTQSQHGGPVLDSESGHMKLAVAAQSGRGDGLYGVFAEINEEGQISKIEIIFE